MPKFSPKGKFHLHIDERRSKDSMFISGIVAEQINMGGAVVYAWLMEGFFSQKNQDGSISTALDEELDGKIQDAILMETRDRKYANDAVRLRGAYKVSESELDFARFGMLMSNDVVQMEFAKSEIERLCGRRFIVGDVLEMPHLRDVGIDGRPMNRYYEVKSIIRSPSGWDHAYENHIVAVTLRPIKDSQEFIDLMERTDKTGKTLQDQISQRGSMEELSGKIQQAAQEHAYTTWWDTSIIYIDPDTQTPERWTDDGLPPNGQVVERVTAFPVGPTDGDYVLRVDMLPMKLYRFQAGKWLLKEVDRKREWGTYNWSVKLGEFFTDQTETQDARPWMYKSIHDLATPRQNRSNPSPKASSYPPAPPVGSWTPMILLPDNYGSTSSSSSNANIPTTTVTLAGNISSATQVHSSLDMIAGAYNAVLIQYTAERDTGQRVGEILINDATSSATMQHEYNDIGTVGLTFTVGISSGIRYLKFTSTAGNQITLTFRVKDKW